MHLWIFLFSNIHTFSSFPLLLQQLAHSTTMFPYGPFDNPHVTCAVSIIFFICCQCSFTSRYFHSPSATTLSLTVAISDYQILQIRAHKPVGLLL